MGGLFGGRNILAAEVGGEDEDVGNGAAVGPSLVVYDVPMYTNDISTIT